MKKIERILSSIFKSVNSPAFEKENVRFLDSLDFENLPDFPTRRDVRQNPTWNVFPVSLLLSSVYLFTLSLIT